MPHPFFGAKDVCYIEKKVAKKKAFLGQASLYRVPIDNKNALVARGAGLGGHLRQQADKRFDARVGQRVVLRVALGLVVACGHRLRAPTHAEEALLPPRVLEGSDAVTTPQVEHPNVKVHP